MITLSPPRPLRSAPPTDKRPARIRLLLLVLLFCVPGCSQTLWRPDLGGALRLAARQNRVVVVAWWSAFDADCLSMEREVLNTPDVAAALRNTVPVRLDARTNARFGEAHGLRMVPAFVVLAPDGRPLRTAQGYMNEGRFRGFLAAARLSL